MRSFGLMVLLVAISGGSATGQEDEDVELRPGLLAEYSAGPTAVQRIDEGIAFVWDESAPDPLLPAGPFTVNWYGQMLVREETTYRFHAFVQGGVQVAIDGRPVLSSERADAGWVSGPDTPLDFGFKSLEVTYQRTAESGRIHVYWSSDRFPLEPLPESILFLPEGDEAATKERDHELRERGRVLFAAHRCGGCHMNSDAQRLEPAPSLAGVGTGTSTEWLLAKIQSQHDGAARSRMPHFGFEERQARAVLAYLLSESQPVDLPALPTVDADPNDKTPGGTVLLHSLGCLACHRVGELGSDAPFGGGDLSEVGARRSREWLYTQLSEPTRINTHSRMPVFELTDAERVALVETLASLRGGVGDDERARVEALAARQEPRPPDADPALIAEGRRLFDDAQCAACHGTADGAAFRPRGGLLNRDVADWDRTCLTESADPAHRRPSYPHADREALQAYVSTLIGRGDALAAPGVAERGRLVVEQRNCLGCHERGGTRDYVATTGRIAAEIAELAGQSQALIPPNLTAVGDKLLDEPLAKSVRGDQKRRMPWLHVRMPKFAHSDADQAALTAYFVGTDRIPEGAPEQRSAPPTADQQTLLAGRALCGPHGFSCIACHECGEYVPPNVAIATHGSDLLGFAQRMRPEFFLRWTRSPLRVVPGIEMPSYERPAPGILDGNPDTQLAALWHALSDPQFSMPTNPAAVEQLLVVRPGDRTVVIRDVFSVSEACGGGYVARALALGFDNGQSVLFDLDKARLREWTLGEFARQRTQGKSWYWDMAGAPLLKSTQSGYGIWLELPDHQPPFLEPSSADGRPIKLKWYSTQDEAHRFGGPSAHFEYSVQFETQAGPLEILVGDYWSKDSSHEVKREVVVNDQPQGRLLVAMPDPEMLGERGDIRVLEGDGPVRLPDGRTAQATTRREGAPVLTLVYESRLRSPDLAPIVIDDPPASAEPVTTAPGFVGTRLPITTAIMPTAMAWRPDGSLVFTSLKGHVYLATDSDGDGVEDALTVFEEGLAAPFGVLPYGDDLYVAHKPELLRLRDTDGDGRCDDRIVVADGWGYTHDYHDWTAGPVGNPDHEMFLAISSDYQQSKRDRSTIQWRGNVLRIDYDGTITPIARELRFPMGIAFDAQDRLFVSDQQGVQNSFNEINHIVEGGRYGVPALADPLGSEDHTRASVQIPHPWTRSVNGIMFLPTTDDERFGEASREGDAPAEPPDQQDAAGNPARREPRPPTLRTAPGRTPLEVFGGHGIGCEYNGRFLVRFTVQDVKGALQGAVYEFTSPTWEQDSDAFLGPICAAVSPDGSLYVGSIFDSGWLGGRNTGEIVRLAPTGEVPNGIREVRAVAGGFEIEFIHPVDPALAADPENYAISGYARVWEGAYATPDSDRHSPKVTAIQVTDDARTVALRCDDLRAQHVYEISCRGLTADGAALRPSAAHYSMNRVP